jgi:hypothetical protein
MNPDDHGIPPTCGPKSDEPTAKPEGTEPGKTSAAAHLVSLSLEILSLAETGQDPERLRQLQGEVDAEQLRRIHEAMAIVRERDLQTALKSPEIWKEFFEPFQRAMRRTDLTFPEWLFLNKLAKQDFDRSWKSVLATKQSIEARLHPARRRNRLPA